MEQTGEQAGTKSTKQLVEQINAWLRSGNYSRALDVLRGAGLEFPDDAELAELERVAQDGLQRKTEADRLITESQELFARQKFAEAIQLLREAYELDKKNSLARAILANALVEHANSLVETDWLEAEKLCNQALSLNPAHPTAKTVRNLIVNLKPTISVEDWVAKARKLQSAGDLFAALAWVAEGLAVHPEDPKLLQVQDAIQRDQGAQRRQARRLDVKELQRMEAEINKAADVVAKQALAERIQGLAAKYWTDGEVLAIANGLLLRLGLVPQGSSPASPHGKGAAVIFHVPRPVAPKPSAAPGSQIQASPAPEGKVSTSAVTPSTLSPTAVPPTPAPTRAVPTTSAPPATAPPRKAPSAPPVPKPVPSQVTVAPVVALPASPAKVISRSTVRTQSKRSNSRTLVFISVAAMILVATIFFVVRKHDTPTTAKAPAAASSVSAPVTTPETSAPNASAPAEIPPEQSQSALPIPPDASTEAVTPEEQPPADSSHDVGTLVVVAGQDDARVLLNGKPQRQLTRAGQLRIPNLALHGYVVQVTKAGFQDPPQQHILIRKGEQAKLVFNLQPQPRFASLSIQGGAPGTTVLVDQTLVGTIQADGALSVVTINPGDHTVELRKERYKPKQFKKHFVAGTAISLAAADAALETVSGELKISFTPADAKVAVVKGDLLKIVSSGTPLSLEPGTYTLTARTAERFTRSSTIEVMAGQSKTLDLVLAPNGMSKWDDPGAWKREGDSFTRRGGDFVLYGIVPAAGTFGFSATSAKGHLLQWVLNYTDAKNYILLQMDEKNFYRSVIHNGEKTDEIIAPHKGEKKSLRMLQIRVTPAEIVHQIRRGDSWIVLDRWTQPGVNLSRGKFGFYIPGNDQVELSGFAHYADLNTR